MTFKWKTITGISIIEACMLALIVWNSLQLLSFSNEKELIKITRTITQLFGATNKDAVISYDLATLESFVTEVLHHPGILYARIRGRDGLVLAERGPQTLLSRKFKADLLYRDVTDGVFDASADISEGGMFFGRVEIGFSIAEIDEVIAAARRKLIAFAGAELLLTSLFSFILGTLLTNMLREFRKGSLEILAGNPGYQVNAHGEDDLAATAAAFNAMSRQLATEVEERHKAEAEQARLEKKLFHAQKMEALGTLSGGIAHDFNNILVPILGYAELINLSLADDSENKEKVHNIIKAVNRAKELIKQILTYSRQTDQEAQPIQIAPIVKESLKLLRSSIPTFIDIQADIQEDCCQILCNTVQIHQMIINLCTNAYQAMMEKGGVLGVTLTTINISPDDYESLYKLPPGPYLRLEVSDTGHGMTEAVMQRIFDPYFTTKKQGEGTGLGLAVVHGIVSTYHGHISVYSKPGNGATFHIYFPCTESSAPRLDTLRGSPIAPGNERILIVDDEEEIITLNRRILTSLGYRVTAMSDSLEALQLFRQHPENYDLVITDMNMPHMSGADLTRKLIEIKPDIPIILSTGFSEIINESQAKELGVKKFLMKPVTLEEFSRAIRLALNATESSGKDAGRVDPDGK